MKNSELVGRGRESQSDADTILVLPAPDANAVRPALESVTGETATVDCHPIILDDAEDETERLLGTKEASRSGLVAKPIRDIAPTQVEEEPETETRKAISRDTDDEATAIRDDIEVPPGLLELEIVGTTDEPEVTETVTEKLGDARREKVTEPVPVPGDISGALETVPLSNALVQHVLAQVDARAAAARAAAPVAPPPAVAASPVAPPRRRIGVEIAIALFTFALVAVPALYYLYLRFG